LLEWEITSELTNDMKWSVSGTGMEWGNRRSYSKRELAKWSVKEIPQIASLPRHHWSFHYTASP